MSLPPIIKKRHFNFSAPNPYGLLEAGFIFEVDGKRICVVALDPESATDPVVRDVLWARLEANATRRCPLCGEKANDPELRPGVMQHGELEHEADCPVCDDNLAGLIRARYLATN